MSASHFTIYRLRTNDDWEKIIDLFNRRKEDSKKFVLSNSNMDVNGIPFNQVSGYKLFVQEAKTSPDWTTTISELDPNINDVENVNYSYILFLHVGSEYFAVTGGSGYQVLEKVKDYNFGLDVLSRLIDKNDNVIKNVNDKYFTGNVLGGNYQYNRSVSLNNDSDFNKFFKEINVQLPSERIEQKLGVEINTKKSDFRFLAKDSIKLGKALTLNELDELLGNIIHLLNAEQGFYINPFYPLNENDALIDELDKILIEELSNKLTNRSTEDFLIIPYFHSLDHFYLFINDRCKYYDSENEIINILNENVDLDKDFSDILAITKQIELVGEIEGNEFERRSLYEHFDVRLMFDQKTYWLTEGIWHTVEREYIEELNNQFVNKVAEEYDHNVEINKLKKWEEGSEGDYNNSHNGLDSVYVLDKMFYKNIEMCDLLVYEEDHIYFVHVKNGLAGEVRVHSAQVENAMELLNQGIYHDGSVLRDFYLNVSKYIQEGNYEESYQSQNARKFCTSFGDVEHFVDDLKLNRGKISFVFAYKPADSHDIFRPSTITSTAAKLSMINLTNNISNYDFGLYFKEIES